MGKRYIVEEVDEDIDPFKLVIGLTVVIFILGAVFGL